MGTVRIPLPHVNAYVLGLAGDGQSEPSVPADCKWLAAVVVDQWSRRSDHQRVDLVLASVRLS
ncbi:hypothetical protein E2C01_079358 [Portunus trituberculatus]|uniref:Uncharacterized protein n=1 Tax=Portunus trituberculatus TaxID=210409 RepID=A0A5B7IWQ4_PORTR|nr:hypothetical protein [Portunus trituberculatus]